MKSTTRLDSVIFQLTPTRTRCDLIIVANEKKEKIASGLLNPFLAHLRTAQDQIARGGYSILLQPEPESDPNWFTKGTIERFVRFVSTPEILERVYTTECEILQIEEAIAIQGSSDNSLSTVEDQRAKSTENSEEAVADTNEKALVLYEPGKQLPETNGSSGDQGEDSRIHLVKVLETRKTVLRKEQGMAFARAVAAGFDIDHMAALVSFSECFGASRLMGACLKFMDLWKRKHETGQWIEIDAAEAMSNRSDISAMNASGIMFSTMADRHNDIHSHTGPQAGGKVAIDGTSDERPSMDRQCPVGQQDYFQGQFPPPLFPAWPMHSPPGVLPVYQAYPGQGMPYYQNYSGNGSYYPPLDNSQISSGHITVQERQSIDGRDRNTESEMHGVEREGSRKKDGRSGKKKSGMVVIRNINYIASNAGNSSGSESEFSESETDVEGRKANVTNKMHKSTSKSSNRDISKSIDASILYDKEETHEAKESGHWLAFQDCLLRHNDEDNHTSNQDMFTMEKGAQSKRRQSGVGDDTLAIYGQDGVEIQDGRIKAVDGQVHRMLRVSNDEASLSGGRSPYGNSRAFANDKMDMQSMDINGRKFMRRTGNDDFIIGGRENQSGLKTLPDLSLNRLERLSNDLNGSLTHDMADESFIVPLRSMSMHQSATDDRAAIDVDSELPAMRNRLENVSDRIISRGSCEPDDLLMPERGTEKRTIGYDPALDYEMEACNEDTYSRNKNKKVTTAVQGSMESDKEQKSRLTPDALSKKKIGGPMRKGKPSKVSPLENARARAERLRAYKVDLQKMKKEKEEAEQKRLEALKMERQKRIAARGSSSSADAQPTLQPKKQLATKLSPVSHRGSKFSDSEPGSSSPLQRSKIRASLGSNESHKVTKSTKSSDGGRLPINRLSRSVSSLSESNKESTGVISDSKDSMSRIRRLSDPRTITQPVTSAKTQKAEPGIKAKVSGGLKSKPSYGPESKKIAAITNLDKSKATTLPELKTKTRKESSSLDTNQSTQTELQKANAHKSSVVSEYSEMSKNKTSYHSDVDNSPVVDKTVVTLECEKPILAVVNSSEEREGVRRDHPVSNQVVEHIESVTGYASIRAPPYPVEGIDTITCQLQYQCPSDLGMADEKESPKFSSLNATEKPYHAPFARVSSLEDPCTENSEYGQSHPASFEMVSTDDEVSKAHISNSQRHMPEKIPETLDKCHVKESSKGFKRLLKFGRKNQSSAALDQSQDSELDDPTRNAFSSDGAHTLKNLIFQDETPTAGSASQKSSRHLSLFSAFRSKTNEKKQTM